MDIRREELPLALLMFGYFFLVIISFWILKPLKKVAFIRFYQELEGVNLLGWQLMGSQAEMLAKVLNMVVALVAVTVFTLLVRSFRRQQLTYIFSAFFIVCFVLYAQILGKPVDAGWVDFLGEGKTAHWTVWSFYLFGDLYSTLMVATFFAFLNDSVDPNAAKRLYGLIGLGGVSGGAVGSTMVRASIKELTYSEWIWVCLGVTLVIAVLAMLAGRMVGGREPMAAPEPEEPKKKGNPALEGGRLVFRSGYLLAIVAIVGLYEMVSTIMDFQFTATIENLLVGEAVDLQFSTVYALTNWVALFVQFFLTSFVMTRFGVGVALLFLPVVALAGSVGFMIFPILWMGSLLNTADNGFSYSINQSAKEVLYVPTTRDEKYKAKAFIDMFVQRFAKALAVGLSLVITTIFAGFESVRWLSLLTALILVLWIVAVRYAGRAFTEKEATG